MFDGNKSLVAIRFGGYPETVLAMSDALFSGSKIALRLPKEKSETELTTHGGNYIRRMKAGDTASECVLRANDDEKKEKDENPRDLYIFCKDESGLFTELDSKLSVPLIPDWEKYFIRELKDRKILKKLNVFSTNTEFAAYAVTLKKGETQIAKVLTDGLESGEICIPNARKDDTAFGDIETFTQYLNAFGKDIAKKIQATFKPVFNPAERCLSPAKTDGMKKQVYAVMDDPDGIFPAQGAYLKFPLSRYCRTRTYDPVVNSRMLSLVEHSAFGVSLRSGYFLFPRRFRSVKRLFAVFLTVFVNFIHQLFFVYLGSLRHCFLCRLFNIGVYLNVCFVCKCRFRRQISCLIYLA